MFDDVCEILEKNGVMMVGNNEGQPPLIGVSFATHDRDLLEKAGLSKEQIDTFFREGEESTQIEKRRDKGEAEIPTESIKIADWLIDKHIEQVEKMSVSPSDLDDMRKLQIDNLRQIAEHLLVFCRSGNRLEN